MGGNHLSSDEDKSDNSNVFLPGIVFLSLRLSNCVPHHKLGIPGPPDARVGYGTSESNGRVDIITLLHVVLPHVRLYLVHKSLKTFYALNTKQPAQDIPSHTSDTASDTINIQTRRIETQR